MLRVVFIYVLVFFGLSSMAQNDSTRDINAQSSKPISAVVDNGDTIANVYLKPYYIFERRTFSSKKERKKYTRLQHNVKVVYPYAKLASQLLNKYESQMDTVTDKKVRKEYYKKVEEELLAEYKEELTKMTISQGRILIKLIDRETNRTSYDLVKNMRSGFTAFFWQGMARMFGHNLKAEYRSEDEDKYIEEIVLAIEQKQL